jgi:hypothetical protein
MTLYPSSMNFSTTACPRFPDAPVTIAVLIFFILLYFIEKKNPSAAAKGFSFTAYSHEYFPPVNT